MRDVELSIIMPVFNTEKYLTQCIESILNQQYKNFELICVDDASTDNSEKIIKNYKKKDKRIKLITNKSNQGQSTCRNIGLSAAKGEYIGFIDSDDYIDINMFEKMLKNIKEQKTDIVMCKVQKFNEKTKKVEKDSYLDLKCFKDKIFFQKPFNHTDTVNFWNGINVAVWNKIFKKDFLTQNNIKFEDNYIFEDLPFFFETYTKAKSISAIDEYCYFYRTNRDDATMTKNTVKLLDRIDMVYKSYLILEKQPYFKEIKTEIVDFLIHDLFFNYLQIDSKYQKEYFFRMQKVYRAIDISDIDTTEILTAYFAYFEKIRNNDYKDVLNYFFNQDKYIEEKYTRFETTKKKAYIKGRQDGEKNLKNEYERRLKETELYFQNKINKLTGQAYENGFKFAENGSKKDYKRELQQTKDFYEKELKHKTDEAYQNGIKDSEDNLKWQFEKELAETKDFYEKEIKEKTDIAFNDGFHTAENSCRQEFNEVINQTKDFYEDKVNQLRKMNSSHKSDDEKYNRMDYLDYLEKLIIEEITKDNID